MLLLQVGLALYKYTQAFEFLGERRAKMMKMRKMKQRAKMQENLTEGGDGTSRRDTCSRSGESRLQNWVLVLPPRAAVAT